MKKQIGQVIAKRVKPPARMVQGKRERRQRNVDTYGRRGKNLSDLIPGEIFNWSFRLWSGYPQDVVVDVVSELKTNIAASCL